MSASYFDLLKYAATGIASPSMTYYDKMRESTLMGGAVQTLTDVPPLSFKSNGSPLISWSMKGNGQSGETPEFVGVRTGNLVDFEAWLIRENVPYTKEGNSYTITSLLNKLLTPYYFSDTDIYVSIRGVMTIPAGSNIRIYIVKRDGTVSGSIALGGNANVKQTKNVLGAGIKFDYASQGTCTVDNLMLNIGSTVLPFEPYGYKIPLTCGGETIQIYIGDPLRKALDGSNAVDVLSSAGTITREVDAEGNALATPTTQIVDVPEIPTVKGSNTLTVDTALQPSEMTVTYKG